LSTTGGQTLQELESKDREGKTEDGKKKMDNWSTPTLSHLKREEGRHYFKNSRFRGGEE